MDKASHSQGRGFRFSSWSVSQIPHDTIKHSQATTKDQSSLEPELRPSSGKYAFQKREREIYFNIKGTHGSKGMEKGIQGK